MSREELGNSIYDSRSVNSSQKLVLKCWVKDFLNSVNLRLTLKVFHNIKKSIVDIWLFDKLNFHLVKITEGILLFY